MKLKIQEGIVVSGTRLILPLFHKSIFLVDYWNQHFLTGGNGFVSDFIYLKNCHELFAHRRATKTFGVGLEHVKL